MCAVTCDFYSSRPRSMRRWELWALWSNGFSFILDVAHGTLALRGWQVEVGMPSRVGSGLRHAYSGPCNGVRAGQVRNARTRTRTRKRTRARTHARAQARARSHNTQHTSHNSQHTTHITHHASHTDTCTCTHTHTCTCTHTHTDTLHTRTHTFT